ncbi:MAG: hypothetical protein FP816_14920 [Desulfobacteraceae bacterium]|nr:hypothetical protein [Desulfobacteraceae bacterium]
MGESKKAVVLSSGGLDSTTVMAMVKDQGYDLYSLNPNPCRTKIIY